MSVRYESVRYLEGFLWSLTGIGPVPRKSVRYNKEWRVSNAIKIVLYFFEIHSNKISFSHNVFAICDLGS